MKSRNVVTCAVGGLELGDDLIEAHRRGVDDTRPFGAEREDLLAHQRPCIEADRAAEDEMSAAERQQVRRAGAGADEMHGHGFTAVHCVTVTAGRKASLPPMASRRSTERRVSVPPTLRCAASTAVSVLRVTAFTTMRPPGFNAAKALSISVGSPPPPMKIASGKGSALSAARASPVTTSRRGTPSSAALRAARVARNGSRSMPTAWVEGWRSSHSMAMEPEPQPMSHSNSPARGAREESVTALISRLVI